MLRIVRELINVQASDRGTDLGGALHYLRNVLKKRSVCFILSDFYSPGYDSALKVLARRHDCIGIHCWDPRERKLPDVGLLLTRDAESGKQIWLDTTDPDLRNHYTERFEDNRYRAASAFRRAGADFISIQTTESYASTLLHFFEKRARVISH